MASFPFLQAMRDGLARVVRQVQEFRRRETRRDEKRLIESKGEIEQKSGFGMNAVITKLAQMQEERKLRTEKMRMLLIPLDEFMAAKDMKEEEHEEKRELGDDDEEGDQLVEQEDEAESCAVQEEELTECSFLIASYRRF